MPVRLIRERSSLGGVDMTGQLCQMQTFIMKEMSARCERWNWCVHSVNFPRRLDTSAFRVRREELSEKEDLQCITWKDCNHLNIPNLIDFLTISRDICQQHTHFKQFFLRNAVVFRTKYSPVFDAYM